MALKRLFSIFRVLVQKLSTNYSKRSPLFIFVQPNLKFKTLPFFTDRKMELRYGENKRLQKIMEG